MILQAAAPRIALAATHSGARNAAASAAAREARRRLLGTASAAQSVHWNHFDLAPPDPIVGLTEAYKADDHPNKVNVGVGAYRSDEGVPHVLPCVREAEQTLLSQNCDHEYAGIAGDAKFVDLALRFAYGEGSVPLEEGRVAGVQTLSGTGGLRVIGETLRTSGHKVIYVPDPTWGNHIPIFRNAGLEVRKYAYYDKSSSSLEFDGMIKNIKEMPEGSCILLHACAHNPTGMDPTMEQWKQISDVIKERNLLPLIDCAYQGFASGDTQRDAAAIRMFVDDGHHLALVQSFSKNFGLYGQRAGALSIVTANPDEAKNVLSQLKLTIRPMYSNPPRHGSRIVSTVLSDRRLREDFMSQCGEMADRIGSMRVRLRSNLEGNGSNLAWDHITSQIGMFAYSGMSGEEVTELRDKHHIYCTLDGRISMAGITSKNVDYVADAIHDVTRHRNECLHTAA